MSFITDPGGQTTAIPRRIPVTAADGQPETRSAHQVLESVCQLLEENLATNRHVLSELRDLNARIGYLSEAGDRTSVKIETGAKRELKPTVHVYAGDTDQAANAWLVEEAIRLHGLTQAYCDEGSTGA